MGNAASEQAKLFEGLGLATFRFVALPLRDIAKNENHTSDLILVIANG